ncbi:MAG: alpha/beta hydrolase [Kineosporiaceae bacterium]|nr:alpha/beta hydrolase [Kineosporiaceae bacterium]
MRDAPQLVTWRARGGGPHDLTRGAVLILPGGYASDRSRYCPLIDLELRGPGRRLAARGAAVGVGVHLLRYRYRGWNDADPVADTRWALDRLAERDGDVPVVLLGYSMGGRAALWAAAGRNVVAVAAIAPWLPGDDPIDQLAGRRVLMVHGTRDRSEARPEWSLDYAVRARGVAVELTRCELDGVGHHVLWRSPSARAMVGDFALGALVAR